MLFPNQETVGHREAVAQILVFCYSCLVWNDAQSIVDLCNHVKTGEGGEIIHSGWKASIGGSNDETEEE